MKRFHLLRSLLIVLFLGGFVLNACSPQQYPPFFVFQVETPTPTPVLFPGRPSYSPGELVDYTAQPGDTLPGLAAHFNTTVEQILEANPIIPQTATTMPAGLPMKIPVYYLPLWGSPFQIIPDRMFVNGPDQIDFDTAAFIDQYPGWLKDASDWGAGQNRTGAEIIDYIASNYSVSPRLLLALLEYQSHALTQPEAPTRNDYMLGYQHYAYRGLYRQLSWAADILNNGYYGWRAGSLKEFEHLDRRLERPDPWQNAATVGLQYYFSRIMNKAKYTRAISPEGLSLTFQDLFGTPWVNNKAHIPGSLEQPPLTLPFRPGATWALTGGPHTAWGEGEPWAALDFAPPSEMGGCFETKLFATAMADGLIVRTETGIAVLDLDGDGDERTGWNIFYLHLANVDMAQTGTRLKAGDPVGHPSCERGSATGTHVHIARKYNGEWILADGALAFNMEGWITHNGSVPYKGKLTRGTTTITASAVSESISFIRSGE